MAESTKHEDTKKQPLPKKKQYANALWIIILPLFIFILLGAFVAIERAGVGLEAASPINNKYMPDAAFLPRAQHNTDLRCLVIANSAEPDTYNAVKNISFVLDQMSVNFTLLDISKSTALPRLADYKTMIISCIDVAPIAAGLTGIFQWVNDGGGLLFAQTPEYELFTSYFYNELGVERGDFDYVPQVWAVMETDLLAGGKGVELTWSNAENENEWRSGGYFYLQDSATVHMSSTGPYGSTPMLWENRVGSGKVVVNNNDAVYERWSRGFIAAMYSLLEPVVAYPVINASVIFIDDFPSPTPEGYNEYIRRDYGVMTDYFMVHIWFPDMLNIAAKHKVKYSGVFIETYRDHVNPAFDPEPLHVNERMKYFGTLFLNNGHEIGMHGYNHQSLVLESFDYEDKLPYNKWPSTQNMVTGLKELSRLYAELFPGRTMTSYVPPSNVLSVEGRAMLRQTFPDLRLISGLLVDDLFDMQDEFEVADDGFIDFPRYTSGLYPFDDPEDTTAFWSILCEMNLHLVNSHFIHPDDVMDPERGARRGWRSMLATFDEYLTWLTQFPIRQMVSEEAGPAVQRFDSLVVHSTLSENTLELDLDGFYDEAWLFIRVNEGVPGQVTGGELTKINDMLYLLKAGNSHITINLEHPAL